MPQHHRTLHIIVLVLFVNSTAGIKSDEGKDMPARAQMRREVLTSTPITHHRSRVEEVHAHTNQEVIVEASGVHMRIDMPAESVKRDEATASTLNSNASRQVLVVEASGPVRADESDADDIQHNVATHEYHALVEDKLVQEADVQAQLARLYKRLDPVASGLPQSCTEFFIDECKLNIPPDGENLTEIEEAFVFCCEDSEHGGHKLATCNSLVEEAFTKSEVTEEECKTLADLYEAHRDLQKDREAMLNRQTMQPVGVNETANASMLDTSLLNKNGPAPAPSPPNSQNGRFTIGSSPVLVQGNDGASPIIIFYHGMEQTCGQCPSLLNRLQQAGYTVISPCDHSMGFALAIWSVGDWGNRVYNDIRTWQNHRKIGVLGYSMGGGAVIKVSYDNGGSDSKVPIVAFHPASMLAGLGFAAGPTLYTTGDGENLAGSAQYVWQTSSATTWDKFGQTSGTKLYLKFGNANHAFPCWHSAEWEVAVKWFDCYIKGAAQNCAKQVYCGSASVIECIGME